MVFSPDSNGSNFRLGVVTVGAPASAGVFMMTINPRLAAAADYAAHLAEWVELYKNATGEGARYPGERAALLEAESQMQGIALAAATRGDLIKVGDDIGAPFNL